MFRTVLSLLLSEVFLPLTLICLAVIFAVFFPEYWGRLMILSLLVIVPGFVFFSSKIKM